MVTAAGSCNNGMGAGSVGRPAAEKASSVQGHPTEASHPGKHVEALRAPKLHPAINVVIIVIFIASRDAHQHAFGPTGVKLLTGALLSSWSTVR